MANASTVAKINAGAAITEDEAAELDHDAALYGPATAWSVGDRVEAGETDDYDTGRVMRVTSDSVLVAWDSGVRTWADASSLRAEGERPVGSAS